MVVQLQKGHMYYLQWACIYKYKRASPTMNCVINGDEGNVKKDTKLLTSSTGRRKDLLDASTEISYLLFVQASVYSEVLYGMNLLHSVSSAKNCFHGKYLLHTHTPSPTKHKLPA